MNRLVCCLILGSLVSGLTAQEKPTGPARWESEIQKFETADRASTAATGAVMFYGSSSARLWNLKESFPGLPTVNRGFGGSRMDDAAYFYDRVVPASKPRVVVLYEGDNDIAGGRTACQVMADFEALVTKHRAALPDSQLICLSVKYSPSRAKFRLEQEAANALLKARCSRDSHLTYCDLATLLLNTNGEPDPKYFMNDMLHLNAEGYAVWSAALRPQLEPPASPPRP